MSSKLNTENFINEIVVPFYNGLNYNESTYIIYDCDGKIITASNMALKLHGYSNIKQVKGKSIDHIYKFSDSSPDFCVDVKMVHSSTIRERSVTDYLCISEFSSGMMAFTGQQTPIFSPDGNIIATIDLLKEIPCHFSSTTTALSKRQAEVVFLLSIGASQKEVASIFNVSRGTIAKTIENICIRLDISGCSERNIIEKATKIGCGRIPKEVIKSGVVPISKLYSNHHVLTLFHNESNFNKVDGGINKVMRPAATNIQLGM